MPYGPDITCEIDLDDGTGCISPRATFSTYANHYGHIPDLTLETVRLGKLQLSREQLIAWVGDAEVKRIEAKYVPDDFDWGADDAACDRADAYAHMLAEARA